MLKYIVMFAVLCGSAAYTPKVEACDGRLARAVVGAPLKVGVGIAKVGRAAVRGAARGLKGAAKVVSYPVRFRIQNKALFPRAKAVVQGRCCR